MECALTSPVRTEYGMFVMFGVPQRSVLGQKIYCMYTKPVSGIIQRHGLSHHSYADDTQLYMTMDYSNNNWRDGLARIQFCVSEISG